MCQMLAPLQQYADKVLPYANAVFWLLYLRALCSDTLGLCSIIALSSLAPKHHLAPRLVPNLAPDLAPGLAPNLRFGAIFFWRRALAPKPIIFGAISCFGAGFQFLVPSFGAGDSLGILIADLGTKLRVVFQMLRVMPCQYLSCHKVPCRVVS